MWLIPFKIVFPVISNAVSAEVHISIFTARKALAQFLNKLSCFPAGIYSFPSERHFSVSNKNGFVNWMDLMVR